MALNSWQKIDRVLSGKPFGNGSDGAKTISSTETQTLTDETCTGTSGAKALTAGGTSLSDGDVVLIIQSQFTGVGQYEINQVSSGGGTVNLVMKENLHDTYVSGAQVIKIPMYTDLTINSSQIWNGVNWVSNIGGIIIAAATGIITNNGTIDHQGGQGGYSTSTYGAGGTGGGYYGGRGATSGTSYRGEGTTANSSASTSTGGNSGAGATIWGEGGGGGHYAAGANGDVNTSGGTGGSAVGVSALTTLFFGGSGGGGCDNAGNRNSGGGSGGGIIFLMGETIDINGSITVKGGNSGGYGHEGGNSVGGAAAGGSILILGDVVDIGTDKFDTRPGYEADGNDGAAGSKGRLAVYYNTSMTGSISATYYGSYTNTQDSTLEQISDTGGAFLQNFI